MLTQHVGAFTKEMESKRRTPCADPSDIRCRRQSHRLCRQKTYWPVRHRSEMALGYCLYNINNPSLAGSCTANKCFHWSIQFFCEISSEGRYTNEAIKKQSGDKACPVSTAGDIRQRGRQQCTKDN